MTTKVYIGQDAKCSCGHAMSAHKRWDPPCPCRACDCEGFHKVARDGAVTMVPVKP